MFNARVFRRVPTLLSPTCQRDRGLADLKVEGDLNRKVRCHSSVVLVDTF
eukprot:SAG31_NODE_34833_length_328_cov_3.441048_1_plen_49_part_01